MRRGIKAGFSFTGHGVCALDTVAAAPLYPRDLGKGFRRHRAAASNPFRLAE